MDRSPLVIGLSGGSGSGKTSIIRVLRKEFGEEELCIISQDDYYRPRDEQATDEKGIKNFDLPESIDGNAFYNDLSKLIDGQTIERIEYTYNNEKKTPKTLKFLPAPVIVVEGLFVFHYKRIWDLLDIRIFIHAKDNLKVIRRIKRDKEERNYPIDDVLYRYEHHVLPTFEKYIAPYKEEVDIVINNNLSFRVGLEFLKSFINDQIARIQKNQDS